MKMNNLGRNIIIVLTIALIAFVLWYFSGIVGYVMISWVLSMLCLPLKHKLEKVTIGKFQIGSTVATSITLVVFFLVLGAVIGLFVPLVLTQARTLAEVDYAAIGQSLEEPIARLNQRLINLGLLHPDKPSPIEQLQDDYLTRVGGFLSGLFGSVLSLTTSLIIGLFSIVFITFFFLKDEYLFQNAISAAVPTDKEENLTTALHHIQDLLTRYFAGVLLQITIITLFVSIGLSLLGVPNALLIGFFAALINVIPYLGPLIGWAFGILMTLASGVNMDFYAELLPLLTSVTIVFVGMQMLDNFILQPVIFSQSVRAHPLEIFIIIMVGAEVYGVIGMVLAIPVYTIFRVIAATFLDQYKLIQRLTKNINV